MKTNTEIRQLKVAIAVLLSVSVMSQSGFISVTKTSCFACFDRAGVGEIKPCCAPASGETDSNMCLSGEPCCESQRVQQVFFSIAHKLENLIPLSVLPAAHSTTDSFELLKRFKLPFRHTHSKAPPLQGRALLQIICKYSL